jgi:hypothetical protein
VENETPDHAVGRMPLLRPHGCKNIVSLLPIRFQATNPPQALLPAWQHAPLDLRWASAMVSAPEHNLETAYLIPLFYVFVQGGATDGLRGLKRCPYEPVPWSALP